MLSCALAHHFGTVAETMKQGGVLYLETAKYLLEITKEQKQTYCDHMVQTAIGHGLQSTGDCGIDADYLVFQFNQQ